MKQNKKGLDQRKAAHSTCFPDEFWQLVLKEEEGCKKNGRDPCFCSDNSARQLGHCVTLENSSAPHQAPCQGREQGFDPQQLNIQFDPTGQSLLASQGNAPAEPVLDNSHPGAPSPYISLICPKPWSRFEIFLRQGNRELVRSPVRAPKAVREQGAPPEAMLYVRLLHLPKRTGYCSQLTGSTNRLGLLGLRSFYPDTRSFKIRRSVFTALNGC